MKTVFPKTITLVLFSMSVSFGYTQSSVSLKAGMNVNSIASDFSLDPDFGEEAKTKAHFGLHLGVTFDFKLSEKMALQPGFLFNSKGFAYDDNLEADDFDKVSINYLEVPVNAKVMFSDNFFGLFGPYIAFGIGGANKYEFAGVSGETDIDFVSSEVSWDEIDDLNGYVAKGFDFGLNLGIGYSFEPISLHVAYGLGLANLNPTLTEVPTIGTINAEDIKQSNRVLSLSISYNLMN